MSSPAARILFVYSRESSFVSIDRDVLGERWAVRDWRQQGPLVNLISLARAVRTSDLVFGWFASWHTFWPVTLAWILRRPSVLVIGGYDTADLPEIPYGIQSRPVMGRVSRWVMRKATRLLANSAYSRAEAQRNAGIDPERVTVVHHGVPDPFGELPAGERERMALTVGIVDRRNVARKGLGAFVQAARLLPDVRFVLAGRWDDAAADELRASASDNVTLTGWVEEEVLNRYYRSASVYVQASAHEGFGLSVAEGMLAGCIPVTTRVGALPEVVGDVGIQVDDQEPGALAAAIAQALERGDDERAAARERVLRCFPLELRRDGVQALVREALTAGGGPR
ncbi:MAG TPA: glycosyltransferase family 4 protein [Gemmatimonadales bacterium]|nr:glycosyltransferase family 4 protein [Gemmatimonadales bacterium]